MLWQRIQQPDVILTKFEKNGKYYGGRSKFDDNFKLTGRYDMFEIIEDEELGYVARQIEDQK